MDSDQGLEVGSINVISPLALQCISRILHLREGVCAAHLSLFWGLQGGSRTLLDNSTALLLYIFFV